MKTKIVYTLVSAESDYYIEQTLVSMYSLRKHNSTCHIVLMTDTETLKSLHEKRARIKDYLNEIIVVNSPDGFNPIERSRFIKTSVRQHVDGDFLYIDNDTIIVDSLEAIDSFDCEIGAVLDYHKLLNERNERMGSNINGYLKKTKKLFWGNHQYFNSGVIYCKDTNDTHLFYNEWHNIWAEERKKFGIRFDQPSFAQANEKTHHIVQEIDGAYNCQIMVNGCARFFLSPIIIHYYASAKLSFPLNNKDFLLKIRREGITEEIEYVIDNPQIVYLENSHIISDEDFNIIQSPMGLLGRKLARDCKWTNSIAKFIYRFKDIKL